MKEKMTPKELREGRTLLTKHPDFSTVLESIFQEIRDTVKEDQSRYSGDWSQTGLVGLSCDNVGKASRIFGFLILDKIGKDKFDDLWTEEKWLSKAAGESHPKQLEEILFFVGKISVVIILLSILISVYTLMKSRWREE